MRVDVEVAGEGSNVGVAVACRLLDPNSMVRKPLVVDLQTKPKRRIQVSLLEIEV